MRAVHSKTFALKISCASGMLVRLAFSGSAASGLALFCSAVKPIGQRLEFPAAIGVHETSKSWVCAHADLEPDALFENVAANIRAQSVGFVDFRLHHLPPRGAKHNGAGGTRCADERLFAFSFGKHVPKGTQAVGVHCRFHVVIRLLVHKSA